jgi:CheY-like chemotaxis protein
MPGDDGFTLMAKVRRRSPEEGGRIPAVALSAHVYPEDHQKAFKAGFQAFLNKPVTAEALLRAVRTALDTLGPVERRHWQRRSFLVGRAVPERRSHHRRREQQQL